MKIHYLDNAATTRVGDAAVDASVAAMRDIYGNPSSVHSMGIAAEKLLEKARKSVADALGCAPNCVIFTSGGTEANNTAILQGLALKKKLGRHIITTAVEHSSVLEPLKWLEQNGYEVNYLRPSADGGVSLDELESLIRPDTAMLSLMLVCNETGARLPVEQAARLFRAKNPNGLVHVDAVQGFLKTRFSPASLGADLLSVSGHKVHAPKGVGALYVSPSITLQPLLRGGGHERGLRSGTEALPAIAGFGAAVDDGSVKLDENIAYVETLMKRLLNGLESIGSLTIIASGAAIATFALPKYPSEVLVRMLESKGVFVSSGAACGRGKPSHVLTAMRIDTKLVKSAVRASLSHTNTQEDVDALLEELRRIV